MQICHLEWSRGQGRTRSSEGTQMKKHFFHSARLKRYQTTPGSAQRRDKKHCHLGAAESTHWLSERSGGLLSLVAHTGLLKCHVLLHISHTLTTAQQTGQGSVWGHRAICRIVLAWSCSGHMWD